MELRPNTVEKAFDHGYNSTSEGMNPFRNTGFSDHELYNAWVDGFTLRKAEDAED